MEKIVECVPNFSEGRNLSIIEKITDELKKVENVVLLDVDPGKDTNRTVVTFAGTPEGIEKAAFLCIKKASELIDMSKHKGAHSRMGAIDVCPFVPVSGVSMEDCIEISKRVGKKVGEELNIPVYLYAESAQRTERRKLPDIREGEYEALPEKLKIMEFAPDFGQAVFNEKCGASAIGARGFLIAYNINLNTREKKIANKIAKRIREKGRIVKNPKTGEKEKIPGLFKGVQGMGWYIDEYNMAQITVNILDYKMTPLYKIFDESERLAIEFGSRVTGSEIVGMIPLDALTESGKYYLKKQGLSTGVSEKELVRIAIQTLGLNEVSPFIPKDRIIEYKFRKKGPLASMNFYSFADELASDSPAPGGGSVAALNGSLSAALSSMVANLTVKKKKYKNVREKMMEIAEEAQSIKDFLLNMVDKDTEAFNKIMDAFSLPKKSKDEVLKRERKIEDATKEATLIPFEVLKKSEKLAELALYVSEFGNMNSISDGGVAGLEAVAAARGAYYNVIINLQGIKNISFKEKIRNDADKLIKKVNVTGKQIEKVLKQKLEL